MIGLDRGGPPPELDQDTVDALTAEYAQTGRDVWNARFIRDALLIVSSSKCSYCEINISEESKYMEVEHFRCKKDFPNLVVDWGNLLPSCKRCNVRKGSYNVEVDGMIIDPCADLPSNHLYLSNYRLRWRDDIGRQTLDALYLNDTDRLVSVRLSIGEAISTSLEVIRESLEGYIGAQQTVRLRNRILRGMEALLSEAQPDSELSATASTILLADPDYVWIRARLIELDLWGPLGALEDTASQITLIP